jgi:hypothetical protein
MLRHLRRSLALSGILVIAVAASAQTPVINEFMSDNETSFPDDDGDHSDWLELYNPSFAAIDLAGYYLSDDPDDPLRWRFTTGTVPARGHLLIWASGKDRQEDGAPIHTNFAIRASGEPLLLTAPDGTTLLDQSPEADLPADVSYGRVSDGSSTWHLFAEPTPAAPNQDGLPHLAAPTLSVEPGFFTTDVHLTLGVDDPEAVIRYTLDGSEPTAASNLYDGEIVVGDREGDPDVYALIPTNNRDPEDHGGWRPPRGEVFKVNVVRARAFREGHAPSPVVTGTYVVTPDLATEVPLPVLSVVTEPENFFADDIGIYVPGDTYEPGDLWSGNYFQRGQEWERPVHVELFDLQGERLFAQQAGVRIHGNFTRSLPQKTLRFAARSEYGDGDFDAEIFPELPHDSYDRFLARNSGDDWGFSGFRDLLFQEMVAGMGFDRQAGRAAVHFVNGEYWGLINLRERFDRHYLVRHHGVPEESVALLAKNAQLEEGHPLDREEYLALREHVSSSDMSQPEALAYAAERMDLENFLAYNIAEIYSANADWPGNNIRFWRRTRDAPDPDAPAEHDGRWRWMMYDVDSAFGNPTHDTMAHATETDGPHWPNPPWSTAMLRGLLENPEFRRDFINTFADHLNSTFASSRLHPIIDSFEARYAPAIAAWQDRWDTEDHFGWRLQAFRNFVESRPHFQRQHIREHFGLPGETTVTLDVDDPATGSLRINSLRIDTDTPGLDDPSQPYPWSGVYFQSVPVTITAQPAPGHRFVAWEGHQSDQPEITMTPGTDPITLTAVFAVDEDAPRVLHAWDFNDLPGDDHLTSIVADSSQFGTAAITYPGTGDGYLDRVDEGTELGALPDTPAGAALRARNPADTRELRVAAPSVGHENLTLHYAVERTTNGAQSHAVEVRVSPHGAWQTVAADITVTGEYQLFAHELGHIAGTANNPHLALRLVFGGSNAGGSSGNQRFDNLTLVGQRIPGANLPPAIIRQVGLQHLVDGTQSHIIDLGTVFSDPDGDPVTFTGVSERPSVATVDIDADELSITPVSQGDTRVAVIAADGNHSPTAQTFRVLVHPRPVLLTQTDHEFLAWEADQPEHTYPDHMLFLQSAVDDPGPDEPLLFPYHIDHDDYHEDDQGSIGFPYDNTGRTRINGLGDAGISFVNTGRGRDLGAAVVALDTRGTDQVQVSWLAGTVHPNERVYALRLQYRIEPAADFQDLLVDGAPVEYVSGSEPGEMVEFSDVTLPPAAIGQPYVQLAWRYHHVDGTSGPRAELRLDDIRIQGGPPVSAPVPSPLTATGLREVAPNPFNPSVTIQFTVRRGERAILQLYDSRGQRVRDLGTFATGEHRVPWNGDDQDGRRCASGVYFLRLESPSAVEVKKLTLVK